jgi:hypothetical protein
MYSVLPPSILQSLWHHKNIIPGNKHFPFSNIVRAELLVRPDLEREGNMHYISHNNLFSLHCPSSNPTVTPGEIASTIKLLVNCVMM